MTVTASSKRFAAFHPTVPIVAHRRHAFLPFSSSSSSSFTADPVLSRPAARPARAIPLMRDSKLPTPYDGRFSRTNSASPSSSSPKPNRPDSPTEDESIVLSVYSEKAKQQQEEEKRDEASQTSENDKTEETSQQLQTNVPAQTTPDQQEQIPENPDTALSATATEIETSTQQDDQKDKATEQNVTDHPAESSEPTAKKAEKDSGDIMVNIGSGGIITSADSDLAVSIRNPIEPISVTSASFKLTPKKMEPLNFEIDDDDDDDLGKGGGGDDGEDNNNNNNGDGKGDDDGEDNEEDNNEERSELIRTLRINEADGEMYTLRELRMLKDGLNTPLLGWLASNWPALRNRLGANRRLGLQMGVEITVGVITKTLAEVQGRGEKFWREFDFYLSDIALEVFGDGILVWLLSPVVRQPASVLFANVPKHFAQVGAFPVAGRAGALVVKGAQFGLAGFSSSVIGHGLTRWLVSNREKRKQAIKAANPEEYADSEEEDGVELAPVLKTSLAWGGFLSTSSNVRYQMVNGIEQRLLEPLVGANLPVLTALTFALRFGNCYVGSMQWLPWAKMWDIQ